MTYKSKGRAGLAAASATGALEFWVQTAEVVNYLVVVPVGLVATALLVIIYSV